MRVHCIIGCSIYISIGYISKRTVWFWSKGKSYEDVGETVLEAEEMEAWNIETAIGGLPE